MGLIFKAAIELYGEVCYHEAVRKSGQPPYENKNGFTVSVIREHADERQKEEM